MTAILGYARVSTTSQDLDAQLAALTAASEVVSYSRVIDAVAPLRWLDRAGRRP